MFSRAIRTKRSRLRFQTWRLRREEEAPRRKDLADVKPRGRKEVRRTRVRCFLRIVVVVVMAVVVMVERRRWPVSRRRARRGSLLHRRRRHRHHRRCSPRRPSNQKLFVMYTYKYYYMLVAIIISNSVIHRLSPSFFSTPTTNSPRPIAPSYYTPSPSLETASPLHYSPANLDSDRTTNSVSTSTPRQRRKLATTGSAKYPSKSTRPRICSDGTSSSQTSPSALCSGTPR